MNDENKTKENLISELATIRQRVAELESLEAEHKRPLKALRNDQGEIVAMVSITRDITERKLAEEARRESEELYRTLFETGPDAIVLLDPNRNIIMVNQPGVSLYGCDRAEEMIGRNIYDFLVPQEQPRAEENAKKLMETGSARNIE